MPLTDSAIKAAKQSLVRRARLLPYKTQMKTMMRKISDAVKEGKKDEAIALLPKVYKAIDTAAKKNIIHPRNADRKKSLVARMVAVKK
jgi:small subunit ribosomal protein S20